MPRKKSARRGQALVESALVTGVFLTLLIGVLDVGQVLFVHQTLVERTRNALRYGAVRPFDADAIRNMFPEGSEEGLFGLLPSMVQVSREDAGTSADRIVIRVTKYPFRFYTPLIAGAYEGKPIIASIPYEGG